MSTASATIEADAERRVDGHGLISQAQALLTVLIRHFGGELDEAQQRSPSDVLHTISMASRALEECVEIPDESSYATSKEAVLLAQDARSALRLLEASAFIEGDRSCSGKVEQTLSDDTVVNVIWCVSEALHKATARSS